MKPLPVETERPPYILEGHEDEIYHELDAKELSGEPEYHTFMRGPVWVFNRAVRWLAAEGGALLCYAEGGDLPLTGEAAVSAWHSAPENRIEPQGEFTLFVKGAETRRRDCAVLPALQLNVEQHPHLELAVAEASADWQFCILIKGRSGAPLLSSGWQVGPRTLTFDLHEALARRGYGLHWAEVHLAIGIWHPAPQQPAALRFRLRLLAAPAVVPCLPVIRTTGCARDEGLPIAALALDGQGHRLGAADVSVHALLPAGKLPLAERDGVWTGRIQGLAKGDYDIALTAEGAVHTQTTLHLRVTDGRFHTYDDAHRSLVRAGQVLGPLSGSYHGTVFFRDAGLTGERIVQGQAAWDAWDRTAPPGEHWHYWEALTERELEERFAYLERCGWNLLHLCQHWGVWERLDAGGHLAPHGAEQLALLLRVAGRHGLAVLQALSHYPYGSQAHHCTTPFQQYYDAGYTDEQWTDPASPFTAMFHRYLADFLSVFRDETALFALSTSGEGDKEAGPARVNATYRFVRSLDPNHLFISEPIFRIQKLPREYYAGWEPAPYGSRLYWIGEAIESEIDLGIEFKLMQLGPVFMAEGSWPCPPLHAHFVGHSDTWHANAHYRTRVRDSLYLGLVYRSPIMLTWDEQCTEDERFILNRVRQQVDWRQPFLAAPIVLRVDSASAVGEGRQTLAAYERHFAALGLMCRYVEGDGALGGQPALIVDARQPYREPAFSPTEREALAHQVPLRVPPGYRASYLWSADRQTLLAYLCNSAAHAEHRYALGLAGVWHRTPQPVPLALSLQHLPGLPLRYRLYDLCGKALVAEGQVSSSIALDLGSTDRDYLLHVAP